MTEELFNFWIGEESDPGTDATIKKHFEDDLTKYVEEKYELWEKDRYGKLAIILLCDQFSRRIYRGTQQAFYFDHYA